MWQHTVAILVGGQSIRMGAPKHSVELPNGNTMLEEMIQFAAATATSTVFVGGEIEGIDTINDLRFQQGPVAGIEALLASGIDESYLLVGCDMPNLNSEHVLALLQCDGNAVFQIEDRLLCLPLKVNANALSSCSTYLDSGKRSINGFLAELPHTCIQLPESESQYYLSMNTPNDLDNLSIEMGSS